MFFNIVTWCIWGIGVVILIFWIIETIREFKVLFSEHEEMEKKGTKKV